MGLQSMPEARRVERNFPCLNQSVREGQREEDVGFSNIVVIHEVGGPGLKCVNVEGPAAIRYPDSELIFLVSLASQRSERKILAVGKIQQRSSSGKQRWRLVVFSPKGAEDPVEARYAKRYAKTWTGAALAYTAREVRLPQTGHQCQPVRY